MNDKLKIILAVTGASGSVYMELLLKKLQNLNSQIVDGCLIFSENALDVWNYERGIIDKSKMPFKVYQNNDLFASPASGSAGYDAMIICPCSMSAIAKIANGISDNLITRSADVIIKERKKLIICPREMPYNLIHIENMKKLTLAGAIICPASPSFYSKPKNLDEALNTVVDKILSLAGFNFKHYKWGEND